MNTFMKLTYPNEPKVVWHRNTIKYSIIHKRLIGTVVYLLPCDIAKKPQRFIGQSETLVSELSCKEREVAV